MSNWGSALAGAFGAVANVGAQALDRQLATQDKIEAEQRAANLQLDLHERMAASDEMRKNRAAERFATITQQKLGEDVPLEAADVNKTGISRESADAAGTGPGFDMNPQALTQLEQNAKAILANPNATEEQKQDAAGILAQLERQKKAQGEINTKDAEGKTRKRTLNEARDAAFADAAVNDAPAFMAGQSMWHQPMQDARQDAKDKTAQDDKDADRASREKIAGMSVEQRRQAAADRDATNRARIEAIAGGKGAKATALMQNVKMLEERGYPKDAIDRFIFQTKDSSEAEKVFKMLTGNNNKYGELSLEDAVKQVRAIEQATGGQPGGSSSSSGGGKVRTWNPKTGKLE
jgi:hypothetical protein